MANILILNPIIPFPLYYSGNSIRVLPISRKIAQQHRCYLAAFGEENQRLYDLKKTGIYQDILLLPSPEGQQTSKKRYLFLRTGSSHKVARPHYYKQVVAVLHNFIKQKHIDLVLAHSAKMPEFAESIPALPKILDEIDCMTLALKRWYAYFRLSLGWYKKLKFKYSLMQTMSWERRLTQKFMYVTTVSPVDKDTLQALNAGGHEKIFDIPNGISPELEDYNCTGEEIENAIAFWGTLDFPPNSTAIDFFYSRVFTKYLQDKGIIFYIIGKNPTEKMIEMGKRHDNIIVTGPVDDLFALSSKIPIMINPMQMGGGLKNKVLEAFALKRLVISNQMGIEAINATPGTHYIHAEEPEHFAQAILKYLQQKNARKKIGENARSFILKNYTWDAIGERYLHLIDQALSASQSACLKKNH